MLYVFIQPALHGTSPVIYNVRSVHHRRRRPALATQTAHVGPVVVFLLGLMTPDEPSLCGTSLTTEQTEPTHHKSMQR